MPRARSGSARHRRKVRTLRAARGYRGGRSKLYRTAKEALIQAGATAYRHRRTRKRDFRALWITRLTAACRSRGMMYSRFMHGLQAAGVALNRKMLSELAIQDPKGFDAIFEIARQNAHNSAA